MNMDINLKEKKKQINKRWNINRSDLHKEAFQKFKQRILNIFKNISVVYPNTVYQTTYKGIDESVTTKSIIDFCTFFGIELQRKNRRTRSRLGYIEYRY